MNKQYLSTISSSRSDNGTSFNPPSQGAESFFRAVLASMEAVYLSRNPTAKAILELVGSASDELIYYDHFVFRTFGVNGYGIDSMAKIFMDFGYTPREELRFPAKKLRALRFSRPSVPIPYGGSGVNGPLPHKPNKATIFIDRCELVDDRDVDSIRDKASWWMVAPKQVVGSTSWVEP
ncbi:hypothetical protein TB1_033577 [Malus domestica]